MRGHRLGTTLAVAVLIAGCGGARTDAPPGDEGPRIHAAAIRHVVGEIERTPDRLLVLDKLCSEAGLSNWTNDCTTALSADDRSALVQAFGESPPPLDFISQVDPVVDQDGFIAGGALLMLLGPAQQDGTEARVGINYTNESPSVASYGASLTLRRENGEWTVTGGSGVGGAA